QAAQETRETIVRTRNGQTIPVSLTGSRIESADPQFQGNIFVARNITDRKRAERRIRYLARYDALTKIPNRMQFHHLLQQPIAHLARSILTEVSRAFQLNQHEVFLTASIGIAFCPRDAENVIDLIRNADAAMYYSKQNGGNTFAFYSPEMNAAAVERLMLKS